MNEIEKLLQQEKEKNDERTAPPELEETLRNALQRAPKKPFYQKRVRFSLVAAILLLVLTSYHYDAFAYYGKKIFGFDGVINGTLQELNDAGKGQVINKSYELSSGAKVTINGLMVDENRMIVYYTFSNLDGVSDTHMEFFQPQRITGLFTNADYQGGGGVFNETDTELKGTMDFETPSPFARKLTLHFWETGENGVMTEQTLEIPYDPNKALQTEIKQSINKTVAVDGGQIKFDSIIASPTMTVIKGSTRVDGFGRVYQPLDGIELIANGRKVDSLGMSTSSTITGSQKIELQFDALPKNLQSLEVNVHQFAGYKEVNEKLLLAESLEEVVEIGGERLWIKSVSKTARGIEIRISTEEPVLLKQVSIQTENEKIELGTTIDEQLTKDQDGLILKERTLVFDTNDLPETFSIGGVYYMKAYDEKIEIQVD